MRQGTDLVAEYHVKLSKQALQCKNPDTDDAIRSKLLQTINENNRYSLSELLKQAAILEDVERQAATIEHNLTPSVSNYRPKECG